MKNHHTSFLDQVEKIKNHPLITEQALAQQRQKIMDIIAEKPIKTAFFSLNTIHWNVLWPIGTAATIVLLVWISSQDHPSKNLPVDNYHHSLTHTHPKSLQENPSKIDIQKEPITDSQKESTPMHHPANNGIEELWSEISVEEMEIYLLEEEEF